MQTLKIIAVIVFGFLLTSSVCQARLGETMDQCIARYGKPPPLPDGVSLPPDSGFDSEAVFYKDGITIIAFFSNGVVVAEGILKRDQSAMSDTEKQTLLNSESAGSTWQITNETNAGVIYKRADDNAFATYDYAKYEFLFYAKKAWDELLARQARSQ